VLTYKDIPAHQSLLLARGGTGKRGFARAGGRIVYLHVKIEGGVKKIIREAEEAFTEKGRGW